MNKSLLILAAIYLITGCAGMNAIHNSRQAIYINDLAKYGEARMVSNVAISPIDDTLYLCIKGDFLKDGNKFYQFPISKELRDANLTKNLPEKLSYKKLIEGCPFVKNKNLQSLEAGKRQTKDEHTSFYFYLNKKYSTHRGDYGDIQVSVGYRGTQLASVDRLTISIKDERVVPFTHTYVELHSIMNDYTYDSHKYESIGLMIDVLTGIIQVPLCVITLTGLCADSPHPYMNISP